MDPDSLSGDIGKCLQWLRKSLLLTQYQLASFTELDYRHYQNIESGRVEIKVETLKRICVSLDIALSTFFYLLECKPWLRQASSRARGSGELYLYRIVFDHAKFRLLAPVRNFLLEWGGSLTQCSRNKLEDCAAACVEVDSEFRILWKNSAATKLLLDGHTELMRGIEDGLIPDFQLAVRLFCEGKVGCFYKEVPFRCALADLPKDFAFVALKPMKARTEQTFFLAMVVLEDGPQPSTSERHLTVQSAHQIFSHDENQP